MSLRNLAAPAFLLVILSGCATTKQPFVYDHPVRTQLVTTPGMIATIAPVIDCRKDDREIDKIYETTPLKDIQTIIKEELACAGCF